MHKRLVLFLLISMLLVSCTKNADSVNAFQGIWVEKTLHLDTLDFEKGNSFGPDQEQNFTLYFGSKSFIDTSINRFNPVVNSGFYTYRFGADSIYLRNMHSSSMSFQPRFFKMSNDKQSFQITKFYVRPALIPTVIEFERVR